MNAENWGVRRSRDFLGLLRHHFINSLRENIDVMLGVLLNRLYQSKSHIFRKVLLILFN